MLWIISARVTLHTHTHTAYIQQSIHYYANFINSLDLPWTTHGVFASVNKKLTMIKVVTCLKFQSAECQMLHCGLTPSNLIPTMNRGTTVTSFLQRRKLKLRVTQEVCGAGRISTQRFLPCCKIYTISNYVLVTIEFIQLLGMD